MLLYKNIRMSVETFPQSQEISLDAIEVAGALQAVLADIPNRGYELESQQEEALRAIGEGVISGQKAGYIESYTGSGKSLMIALLTEAAVKAGKRVHILAPTNTIADQLIGEDGKTGIGLFAPDILPDVRHNYGGRKGSAGSLVNVSTYPGALAEAKAKEAGRPGRLGSFNIILGDECHESLGTETSRMMVREHPGSIRIGFSATPDYADDRRSAEVFERRWLNYSLPEAIENGKTAPIRALLMSTDATLDLSDYQRDYTEKELAPLMKNPERNGLGLKLAQDFVASGRRGFIACIAGQGNAHAELMAEMLSKLEVNGRKIVAKSIGSHVSVEEARRLKQEFNEGKIDVLTFTQMLEQGWDSIADFGINMQPSTSPRRIKQLLGRLARRKKDGRESIFVDFVDEQRGLYKAQYTALHALELEDVDNDRVLGYQTSTHSPRRPRGISRLREIISPDLLARLMRVQGKLVHDVLVGRQTETVDPLFAEWEQKLTDEGMPAELPENPFFTPRLQQKYTRAVAKLALQGNFDPTNDEIADVLNGAQYEAEIVRELGRRVIWSDEAAADTFVDPNPSVDELASRLGLAKVMQTQLRTLSEREAGILRLRAEERTYDEIGQVFGVTRERIRQIESKAMSRMRHPSRSKFLRRFAEEMDEEVLKVLPAASEDTIFGDVREKVALYDPADSRSYLERLAEASKDAARALLDSNLALLNASNWSAANMTRERERVRAEIARHELVQRRIMSWRVTPQTEWSKAAATLVSGDKIKALQQYVDYLQKRMDGWAASLPTFHE